MRVTNKSPNTIDNKIKILCDLLKWFKSQEEFCNNLMTIKQSLNYLKETKCSFKIANNIRKKNANSVEKLTEKGHWLNEMELKKLLLESLQLIKKLMSENSNSKNNAIKFEEVLITLCMFSIGGQRREFIVNMSLDSFKWNSIKNTYTIHIPGEKVIRVCISDVPVPI